MAAPLVPQRQWINCIQQIQADAALAFVRFVGFHENNSHVHCYRCPLSARICSKPWLWLCDCSESTLGSVTWRMTFLFIFYHSPGLQDQIRGRASADGSSNRLQRCLHASEPWQCLTFAAARAAWTRSRTRAEITKRASGALKSSYSSVLLVRRLQSSSMMSEKGFYRSP